MAGAFTEMISNAKDAVLGSSSGTTLQTFLKKFSEPAGRYVNTLDLLQTFDVKFRFYPSLTAAELSRQDKPGALGRIGNSLLKSVKQMGTNLLDNVTGGIFSSATAKSVQDQHKNFKKAGEHTFMEYLAPAHGLEGGETWQNAEQSGCPLELELGLYVQDITVPNLKLGPTGKGDSPFGEFELPSGYVQSDGGFTMDILNTKASLHERIFYPWLRETTMPFWSYDSQPYTTATVTIDWTKHNSCKYVFVGCRPISINTMDAHQDASANPVRQVGFHYDFMFITSDLATIDSTGKRIMNTLGSLGTGVANMLNMT